MKSRSSDGATLLFLYKKIKVQWPTTLQRPSRKKSRSSFTSIERDRVRRCSWKLAYNRLLMQYFSANWIQVKGKTNGLDPRRYSAFVPTSAFPLLCDLLRRAGIKKPLASYQNTRTATGKIWVRQQRLLPELVATAPDNWFSGLSWFNLEIQGDEQETFSWASSRLWTWTGGLWPHYCI